MSDVAQASETRLSAPPVATACGAAQAAASPPVPRLLVGLGRMLLGIGAIVPALWLAMLATSPSAPSQFLWPALAIGVAVVGLRQRPERQASAAIWLVAAMIALSIAEGFQMRRVHEANRALAAAKAGVAYDSRTAAQVVLDLRQSQRDAVVGFRHWPDRAKGGLMALAGVSRVTTVLCNESGSYAIYNADEHGFNNPRGLWDAGRPQIALLGDSLVQGFCVPPEDTIAGHMRRRVPGTLNVGYGGNGPLANLAALREYVGPLKPPVVVWFHYEGNDVSDLNEEKRNPRLMAYLQSATTQHLLDRQNQIDGEARELMTTDALEEVRRREERIRHPRLPADMPWKNRLTLGYLQSQWGPECPWIPVVQFLKLSDLREQLRTAIDGLKPDPVKQLDEPLLRQVLTKARDEVSEWGGQLYVVYLPEWERYRWLGHGNMWRDPVLRLVADLRIPLIDLHQRFQAAGDPLQFFPFRMSGHYTPVGYRLVANEVLAALNVSAAPSAFASIMTEHSATAQDR